MADVCHALCGCPIHFPNGPAARLQRLWDTIEKIHQPVDEEAEFWAESGRDDGAEHDRRFPDCLGGDRCEGHTATIEVCTECGYEHDGEQPVYRAWPCPTIRAIRQARERDHESDFDEPRCSVKGCSHPALAGCPCCYGHTVDADDPRHLPTPKLPTVDDLVGSDPDFTGGLEASEYVRRLRGDDPSGSDESKSRREGS